MEEPQTAPAEVAEAAQPELVEAPKKKRGRPRKQRPQAQLARSEAEPKEIAGNAQATTPLPQLAVKQKKRGGKKKFKLTQFDKDALKLARRGGASAAAVSAKLGVGEPAVEKRLQQMAEAGLLAKNEGASDFHLTVKGYNEYSPDSTETSLEERARKRGEALRKKEEKQRALVQAALKEKTRDEKVAESLESASNSARIQPQPEAVEKVSNEIIVLSETPAPPYIDEESEERGEKVDLSELLARGAPKPGEQFSKPHKARRLDKTVAEINIPTKQHSKAKEGDEKCVLCRTGFVLSVGGGNPKYGHCFCGGAYHKDCYEGVVEASGECIQCGKKLDIIIDKASLDEVKKIKDVFG